VRAVSSTASVVRHISSVGLQALIIVGIVATLLLALSPVFKPADDIAGIAGVSAVRSTGHITVPDGVYGGTTTATLNPGGTGIWAYARCYQGETLVYAETVRANSSNEATFTLGPTPLWTGGAANCTAEEGTWSRNHKWRAVAATTFNVTD
jgi:hypothetical protein